MKAIWIALCCFIGSYPAWSQDNTIKRVEVNGISMLPSFKHKEIVGLQVLSAEDRTKLQRGDVVLAEYTLSGRQRMTSESVEPLRALLKPGQENLFDLKRIVGLPNETLIIRNGEVWINPKQKLDLEHDYDRPAEFFSKDEDEQWWLNREDRLFKRRDGKYVELEESKYLVDSYLPMWLLSIIQDPPWALPPKVYLGATKLEEPYISLKLYNVNNEEDYEELMQNTMVASNPRKYVPMVLTAMYGSAGRTRSFRVPEGHYFLLSDNRLVSNVDSRLFGAVKASKIGFRVTTRR